MSQTIRVAHPETTHFAKRIFNLFARLFCLVSTLLIFDANAEKFSIVFAADMPEIDSPESGRYAELDFLVKSIREKNTIDFFIFGGGSIGPSAMSSFDRGSHIIDILNTLEPDAMGVTKREFSYFEDELSLRAYEAAFPLVASNVVDNRSNMLISGLEESALITKGDTSLGVISIINQRVVEEYLLDSVRVTSAQAQIKKLSNELKGLGADIILVHYSYPFPFMLELLDDSTVDIAFLSDTRLTEKFGDDGTQHPRLITLTAPNVAILLEGNSDNLGDSLSVKEIVLSNTRKDLATQIQIDQYKSRVNRLLDEQIGIWTVPVSTLRESVRSSENRFANFIAEVMRHKANSDFALINGGSIRGNLEYSVNTPITRKTIAQELPFRSRLAVISVTGEQIYKAIEQGLSQLDTLKGSFPHVAGLSYTFDSSKPPLQRVVEITIDGNEIDREKVYSLATTDYLANGGDGFDVLTKARSVDKSATKLLISDLVISRIRTIEEFNQTLDGRIKNAAVKK